MKNLIVGLITAFTVSISFGQYTESLDYCNCQDKIDQVTPDLNGQYERKCNDVLIEKGEFIHGEKNGEWITYSRKGKLIRKLHYDNGLFDGKVELFYVNGKPKLTGQFAKGSKIGKWIYYTKKGKILSAGSYRNNKPIDTWTINNKKGKKSLVQYDFNSKKYLVNKSVPIHKDEEIVQNENTEEWYILRVPDLDYSLKTKPLGGNEFANFMFAELVEVPANYWDTYLYNIYKIIYKISSDNELTFDVQLFEGDLPDDDLEIVYLIVTNPKPKIKKLDHSDIQLKLLGFKIKEALSLMPPWIYHDDSEIEIYLHYVINENLHR